jgi:hypothetical protein
MNRSAEIDSTIASHRRQPSPHRDPSADDPQEPASADADSIDVRAILITNRKLSIVFKSHAIRESCAKRLEHARDAIAIRAACVHA